MLQQFVRNAFKQFVRQLTAHQRRFDQSGPVAERLPSRAFSCFVDRDPVLQAQAFIWVNCLTRLQRIDPERIFVHTSRQVGSEFRGWLTHERVNIIEAEYFDRRNPYCNKLQQLPTFCGSDYDQVVFMDCDTAWVGKEDLPLGAPVFARTVDHANPPPQVLEAIFSASGLGAPLWHPVVFPEECSQITDLNNCNGGVYICSGKFVSELAPRWKHWALWCLENSDLFGESALHADQVSFALAMRELDARVCPLGLEWNYPTHLPAQQLPDISPQIIHYHRELAGNLKLKTVGIPAVDTVIDDLNRHIADWVSDNFLHIAFSNSRCVIDPELGSGHALNDTDLQAKRRMISAALNSLEDCSYQDITAFAADKASDPAADSGSCRDEISDLIQRVQAAGLSDFNALLAFKRELIALLGIEEAFDVYRTLQVPDSDCLTLTRVKGQHAHARTSAEQFVELEPGGAKFTIPLPTVVGATEAPELTNTARSLYIACLRDARVRGRSAVIQVDGTALFDFQGDELKQYGNDIDLDPAVFHGNKQLVWLLNPRNGLDTLNFDSAFTLLGLNTGAFGDWMMYFLPKYIAADMSGLLPRVPILMPSEVPETVLQCLRLMAPPDVEIVQLPAFVTARVRHLWCASSLGRAELRENFDGSFDFGSLAPPPERFARVVQEIARRAHRSPGGGGGPERVFLARKSARWRKLVNDDKIHTIAQKYDFAVVYPEDLDFLEQIKLMSNARFVIAPEGSAISLCYFAPKGVRVLVLNHTRFIGLALYNILLHAVEADITVMTGPIVDEYGPHAVRSDYRIDEPVFEDFVASACASRPA